MLGSATTFEEFGCIGLCVDLDNLDIVEEEGRADEGGVCVER